MKTFLAIIVIALSLGGCEGIRQSNDNEPSATYRPLPKTAACPHDGKHGDDATITVAHNGKTATQVIALTELLENRPDQIADIALATFNATQSDDDFEPWMARVYKLAPRYHLKLHPPDKPTEREWFYLYYWQSGVSPKQAIIEALRSDFLNHDVNVRAVNDTLRSWLIHYEIYKHGVRQQIGYGREMAPTRGAAIARLKWETSNEGQLKILSIHVEKAK